jgi:arabinofuranan 3-O-arabinosyltransferase
MTRVDDPVLPNSHHAGDSGAENRSERSTSLEHLRLAVICAALTLLVFAQSSGNAATDTKFDLVVSPLRFLGRSLRLWDPTGGAGQLQNQAYGYLFPMGPFFAAVHALGLAPWEIQRLWEAVVIIAAFVGVYRVSGALGVIGFWPNVAAGLVYALAPRSLSELTTISSELMPVAALPWVLLPLVKGATTGSPRRAAARSGVALLFAGAVNAAATLAILPVPAIWLLTRSRGPRRRSLASWWIASVALACFWWALPLVVLGKYSPPFLDWIESASTTTLPTSLIASLRGADHWEMYLGAAIWPAGWIFAAAPAAIAATSAVAAAGLAGIAMRTTKHRIFLVSVLILGLLCVTAGHGSAAAPPWAGQLRGLLDTGLVAFRNVHKFDPLIRLPIAIGVGHLLAWGARKIPRRKLVALRGVSIAVPAAALAVLAIVGIGLVAISPALNNRVVTSQRITTEPGWWTQAANWLGTHGGGARTLVVPASASPVYLWGGTVDNALQPVAESPWTTRDSVPLAQAGYIRLLDAIDDELAAGADDPDLAALLARAGIGFVLLANDLNTFSSASTPLVLERATLTSSPGFTPVASFGPDEGGSLSPTNELDEGDGVPRSSIQIFSVSDWPGRVSLEPLAGAVKATGSADGLEGLLARGLTATTPVFFGNDAPAVAGTDMLAVDTDGIRKREASFGALLAKSPTMMADQPYSSNRPVHDYLPADPGPLSAFSYRGIKDVSASSSGDQLLALVNRDPANGPWSALDGDGTTAWKSSSFGGSVGQWLQMDFLSPVSSPVATIDFAPDLGPIPTKIAVTADGRTVLDTVTPLPGTQTISLPPGPMLSLRITVLAVAGSGKGTSVGITELSVPGVQPGRTLGVASVSGPVDEFDFTASTGYRSTCLPSFAAEYCDPSYGATGEEDAGIDRTFQLTAAGTYNASATVRLRGGTRLDALLDAGSPVTVTASSVFSTDPRQRPGAVVDGDPNTAWQAADGDQRPTLTLNLGQVRTVRGVTLTTTPGVGLAAPIKVEVRAGDQNWTGDVPAGGHIIFDSPATTNTIVVTVLIAEVIHSTSTTTLQTRLEPVGISELAIDADGLAVDNTTSGEIDLGCTSGLAVAVDGQQIRLSVRAARSEVLSGAAVVAQACSPNPVQLPAGGHRVQLLSTPMTTPVSLTLSSPDESLAEADGVGSTMQVRSWGPTDRSVQVNSKSPSVLVVRENFNTGWQAKVDGHRLTAARVDGWQQAFLVPAGTSGLVQLTFAPQRPFIMGLIAGGLAVIAVLALAFCPRRRSEAQLAGLVDGRVARSVVLIVGGTAMFLLAGGWGLVAAASVAVAAALVGRRRPGLPWIVPGVLLAFAGVLVARASEFQVFARANSLTCQVICALAVSAAAFGSAEPGPALETPVRDGLQGRDP